MLYIPTYFAPISQYVSILKNSEFVFEVEDNFQKQTYRNRCKIYGANGLLQLNIPIVHNKNVRQKTKDIKIENSFNWQTQHFKSLEVAYRSSPYFEFYEDDLRPLYEEKQEYLQDFNLKCHEFVMNAIQEEIPYKKTTDYDVEPSIKDRRHLAIAKKEPIYGFNEYYQIFSDKHGFIENLSILDLLFMQGNSTEQYLKKQTTHQNIEL